MLFNQLAKLSFSALAASFNLPFNQTTQSEAVG